MHSLPFRQKFRQLTVMAAPAANEAQLQGPQVPRVSQANVVQLILAERPPQKPIFDTNALEVMCLSFFHTSLALLPLFMWTCRHVLISPFPAFTCVVFVLHSIQPPGLRCSLPCYQLFVPICISFQFFRHETLFIRCCFMADVFYCFVAVVYHEGILIYLFPRHEKFFYSFVPSWSMLFIAFLLLFIPQSLILGTIASLCFY